MVAFKPIFPKGEPNEAYASVFTGQSYLAALAQAPDKQFAIGNVTFEPSCRNNWHAHQDGYQLLLVTDGEGLYQEEGKPAQELKAGDVVVTQAGVKHWHGAKSNSWFSHVAITAGRAEWFEPVSDQEYIAAQAK
ncbi:cupin domain-containing protein [Streptococcus sp. ZJ151]|uniref:cupin domain-containing protein n=1 Tax=Streptococcus jiangjianxini TaxID=3161189 RepID=UPI0032EC1FD9